MVVSAERGVLTDDAGFQVMLPQSTMGIVGSVESDGDALIYLAPTVGAEPRFGGNWLLHDKFDTLEMVSRRAGPDADALMFESFAGSSLIRDAIVFGKRPNLCTEQRGD